RQPPFFCCWLVSAGRSGNTRTTAQSARHWKRRLRPPCTEQLAPDARSIRRRSSRPPFKPPFKPPLKPALARILRQPLASFDRPIPARLLDAPLARQLRIDNQRPVDFDAIVIGKHRIERLQLAEYTDLLLRQIDLRVALQNPACLDRLLERRTRRQLK